ncbi:DUF21-domain-containing protein, partial [Nadsonia fulvescens var. elongata DSM 6958]
LPFFSATSASAVEEEPLSAGQFWLYMIVSGMLVILGGIFAGLTLGLMGQDEVNLNVILQSSESLVERENARKVLKLLKRGKHWVLVTLLLSNVITNESLPVVLDRCLGGGWPAVVCSTIAIVIFGEVIPQSVCVRYGLGVGAWLSPFVLALMYVMYPVAYPTAKLLDHLLGEDHGTIYKKAGLKTLVNLHHTMGVNAERLNEDEVTIITAVLDLKAKPVGSIMTPLEDVYTMSADRILDEDTIDKILNAGFSRIPIHQPNEPTNYIGMLLVRILISYDPEDALPVSSFPLATLPETRPDTSCLNILNYFQEGKSHMILVSDTPGESTGALGILTLEDVIEELIGEEIIDESDVFIDIHRAIRRTQPGPLSKRVTFNQYVHNQHTHGCNNTPVVGNERDENEDWDSNLLSPTPSHPPSLLNPKNPAANPIMTSNTKVTIKKIPDGIFTKPQARENRTLNPSIVPTMTPVTPIEQDALSTGLALTRALNSRRSSQGENDILINGGSSNAYGSMSNSATIPTPGSVSTTPATPTSSSHSYLRTGGGIIESVVIVQGVNKTII